MTDKHMTNEKLQEINGRAEKATPGPWDDAYGAVYADGYQVCDVVLENDVPFIKFARTDIPDLIAEVERLRNSNEVLAETVSQYEAENRWIPIEESLPESGNIHCVSVRRGYVTFGYFDSVKCEWWKYDDDGLISVTHWRPLPTPPDSVDPAKIEDRRKEMEKGG